ncbi:MAG: AI-2E family transporter, partial [Acidobacteriota bacterium]|nr:AI-2E family transporter [Acidobacteriota bacterium]
ARLPLLAVAALEGWTTAGITFAASVVIENAKGYVISPFVEGDQLDIHPLLVFTSVLVGAALLGAGGAATGAAVGGSLEDSMAKGLPHDELFVYEDALRRGRSVVIAVADDEEQSNVARGVLTQAGAESVDAAREKWWLGLRDAEEAEYTVDGGDFGTDEPTYRRGFEAALHPRARSRSYEADAERLRECFGKECEEGAFRRGYERGRRYQDEMLERYKS